MEPMFSRDQLYGENGHRKSRALFVETSGRPHIDKPFLCLNPNRKEGDYIPLQPLFISLTVDDPSEATFAETVFGDIPFWESLKTCTWFKDYYEEWAYVAEVKRKSKAFKAIVQEAEDGRSKFTAAKFLIEEPWKDKRNPKAKARSKKTTEVARMDAEVESDIERLREQGLLN